MLKSGDDLGHKDQSRFKMASRGKRRQKGPRLGPIAAE